MAVYYITGGLGSGKSLQCINKIKEYIEQGRRVVTNYDLYLDEIIDENVTDVDVRRIPDHPDINDLKAIGKGYDHENPRHYDQSKFGALVLDELGTWFNSREWNKKGRHEVIQWLLHARKHRWDLFLIIQDLDLLDSQARAATAKQFVVYCQGLSDFSIPFLSFFYKFFFGKPLKLPAAYLAVVKNGMSRDALVADRWLIRGNRYKKLINGYATGQEFFTKEDIESVGHASYLAPWYTKGRYSVPFSIDVIRKMIVDRIEWVLGFSVFSVLASLSFAGYSAIHQPEMRISDEQIAKIKQAVTVQAIPGESVSSDSELVSSITPTDPQDCSALESEYVGFRISGSVSDGVKTSYTLESDTHLLSTRNLLQSGYVIRSSGACRFDLTDIDGCSVTFTCGSPLSLPSAQPEVETETKHDNALSSIL